MNTSYFWMDKLGLLAIPFSIFLFLLYIFLAVALLYQVYWVINEKLHNRKRNVLVVVMGVALSLVFLWQDGIISFEKYEDKDLFIAEREGAANCYTTLKLKDNNRFIEKNICFGISEVTGKYSIKGDSIFFSDVQLSRDKDEYYQFAVIKQSAFENKKIIGELKRFMNYNDTLPHELWITKNELNN